MKKHLFSIATLALGLSINAQVCLIPSSTSPFTVGVNPYSVTSADFNSDGKADLAVANYSSTNVSLLLGNGVGSFAPAVNFPVGTNPRSVTSADFNADGKADLAVVNQLNDNVSVLLGNGAGSFATAVNFVVGASPSSVISADFNNDGKADLATANPNSNNVSVLFGNGAGSFAAAISFPIGTQPRYIISADFNGDGKADLATANPNNNNVSVLLGNGGSFAAAINFPVGTQPRSVINADFNADGKADLATADGGSNKVSVLLNETPFVTANATATVVCEGASITLSGGGATTYTWTAGVSNGVAFIPPTGSTTYTVTGTNTVGCTNTATKVITVNTLPTIVVNSGSICNGQSFTIIASGAISYTYSGGSNNVSPTVNTNYNVTGTSAQGCVSSNTAVSSVTGNANPTVTAITTSTVGCAGTSFTLSGGGATTYTWSANAGSATTATVAVTPSVTTNYTVTGTDANGCSNNAIVTQSVVSCVGIQDLGLYNTNISIYPNPASQFTTINLDQITANEIRIEMVNSLGQLILNEHEYGNTITINLSNLANGLYIVKVINGKEVLAIKKIMKQ